MVDMSNLPLIIIYTFLYVKPLRFYNYCIILSTLMVNTFFALFFVTKNGKAEHIYVICQN